MKANTTQHVKFKRLCRKLGISRWEAIGLLESIWHLAASSAPAGDIGKHSNEDIAALIEWNADEDAMVDALVVCGWLDEHPEHRLVVHDWHDHCPTYIKGNLARSGDEFATKSVSQLGTKEGDSQLGTKEPDSSTCPEVNTTKPSQAKPSQAKPKTEAGGARDSSAKPEEVALPPPLNTPTFSAKWDEWHAYRREARLAKWIPRTCKTQLAKLSEIGHDHAIATIDTSIGNGWHGLFPGKSGAGPAGDRKTPGSGTAAERASARRGEIPSDNLDIPSVSYTDSE